jgi:Tol biopolymer transport system component
LAPGQAAQGAEANSSAPAPAVTPADWLKRAKISLAAGDEDRHSMHAYYVHCPESPDGRWLLYYTSTTADGHTGQVCVRERATGQETVVARNVTCEDAHRVACQQWTMNGAKVAFHDVRDGRWRVVVVDRAGGAEQVVGLDYQVGFGSPTGSLIPMYGCHWNPGEHRSIDAFDLKTGQLRTIVPIAAVHDQYDEYLKKQFGSLPVSTFFPVVSPDEQRLFFKMAGNSMGNDFRTKGASQRQGLFIYSIAEGRFLHMVGKWGHPAWKSDSRTILEMANRVIDTDRGSETRIPNLPSFSGCHPSFSPDGTLFVCDAVLNESLGGPVGDWGIVVGDVRGEKFEIIHRFNNNRGARSWRVSHPHPIFSHDGKRIYFNVSSGPRTQLHVAELGE